MYANENQQIEVFLKAFIIDMTSCRQKNTMNNTVYYLPGMDGRLNTGLGRGLIVT